MSRPLTSESLAAAREETYALLGSVAHYCRCAQMHLEVADDAVALLGFGDGLGVFHRARAVFKPIRQVTEGSKQNTLHHLEEAA